LDRAFLVVSAVADSETPIGLAELAKRVKLHKSTVHRMSVVLERHGYIERDDTSGNYRLGRKLCELGMRAAALVDIAVAARPLLQQLVTATGETAHVAVLRGGQVVSLAYVETTWQVRSPATVGCRSAAYTTASGKAILAFSPSWTVDHYLSTTALTAFTRNTITTSARFRAALEEVRERGYAMDDEEFEEGLRCVAAPVRDYSGQVIASIGIAGPASRLTPQRMEKVSGHVITAATQLSERLGFSTDPNATVS
jgi:DNA-binding IclR family transcriptional regulator